MSENTMCEGERLWSEVDQAVEAWIAEHPNWLDEPIEDDPILAKLYRDPGPLERAVKV